MNLKTVVRDRKDPYLHGAGQEEIYGGGVGQETPGDAQKLVTQGKKVYTLTYANGVWTLDKNNGTDAILVADYYNPDFRVRFLKVWATDVQAGDLANAQMEYDTPQSEHVIDYWQVSVMHKIWITRVYLGANTTQGIISLVG